ncbi:hypothetical protein H0G86_010198 [Trichoderma simmonsii]|uniref:Myb-like domain-containing protein n=1 Tax=Trichoderma simmonsii TaxID=1491479 RepID=A0A8G0LLZ8_9HYPO|nr:hypothetical protein H0G86_010198 [Trichoderma simmonsii]
MTGPGYITKSGSAQRMGQGVTKNRKATHTGGGRAWSEAEEHYLVETRLQKVPYKQIAVHLNKTELACRLHYHQITTGRRKESISESSPEMAVQGSLLAAPPVLPPASQLPTEHVSMHRRNESYSSTSSGGSVQLPSIVDNWAFPQLPIILPKPAAMPDPNSQSVPRYREDLVYMEPHPHATQHHEMHGGFSLPSTATQPPARVDVSRLHAIYNTHRATFWDAVARDYGLNASPDMLETAWKLNQRVAQPAMPPTPATSPKVELRRDSSADRTSIASILGTNAPATPPGRW